MVQINWTVQAENDLKSIAEFISKLELANEIQGNFLKISPSGYRIRWPLLDEGLSIDFLLKTV